MANVAEIPDLDDPFIVELSVCARVRSSSERIISALRRLAKTGMVARVKKNHDDAYIELFSGGSIKNHLHVNLIVRPQSWRKRADLVPLTKIQETIAKFFGKSAKVIIHGKFFVPIDDLPRSGIIRSAIGEVKTSGLTVRQTAQTLKINDETLDELRWSIAPDERFAIVRLSVNWETEIGPEYLRDCEAFISGGFRALILTEKKDAATNK